MEPVRKTLEISHPNGVAGSAERDRRESLLRSWIANKESVCPYAPGAAKYIHLPLEFSEEMEWAAYFGKVLKEFYATRVKGKQVERLILIPPVEWQSHQEAKEYATKMFWRTLAGYYVQCLNGRKLVGAALKGDISEINACDEHGIANPIIGRLSEERKSQPHFKSLFFSAFSPIYRSKNFFRYAPCSALVLVNAKSLFNKRRKSPRVMAGINEDILYGSVQESTGAQFGMSKKQLVDEANLWEKILFKLYRETTPNWMRLPEPDFEKTLSRLDKGLTNAAFMKLFNNLPVMHTLCKDYEVTPERVLKACYLHAGLYVTPRYIAS